MAAIYSGIHLKLKSPQTQWEDKLKLARFAWISSQCLLPNKEQVLLDWCTHALTGWYSQKVEFSQDVLEGLWCYLDDLLHSRKLHSLVKQGKTISLRLNMAQLLLDRLHECVRVSTRPSVGVSTLLSVCKGILSSPALSSVFTTKYELMVDLAVKFCSLACHELQQPSLSGPLQDAMQPEHTTESVTPHDEPVTHTQLISDSSIAQSEPVAEPLLIDSSESKSKPKENIRSAHLFEVLHQSLSCYLSVQRQQANPNRVFTMVTNQLIQTITVLRYLLTSGEYTLSRTHLCLRPQLCRDIRIKLDSILQLALFPPEHLSSYKEELLPSKEDCGKRGAGGAKGLLKPVSNILSKLSAQGFCESTLHYTMRANSSSVLFKFFLESYGKGRGESEEEQKMLCFHFLTRLTSLLDVSLDAASSVQPDQSVCVSPPTSLCSPESWSLALLAVEALLSQALSADIYNVAADRIRHGEVQLNFYRGLAQILFNHAQPSIPAWYRCLKALLSLNHLILEPDLDQLLSSAWVNAECMETRVQLARQVLVSSLLQTYTKLRQLPRLFSVLLSIICQPALDDLRPPLLSEMMSASLRSCLQDTPPSQVLEICSLVLQSIKSFILPGLMKDTTEVEEMELEDNGGDERESGEEMADQEKRDASLKLFSLSQLLHAVLFNLKTLENASPLPLVKQSRSLMEEMQLVVKELLQLVSLEKKNSNGVQTTKGSTKKTPKKGKTDLDHNHSQKVSDYETVVMWTQKTQEAALLLRYTWVEVDTLFHIHCSKYTSLESPQAIEGQDEACALVLSGVSFPASVSSPSCSPMSCLLLKLLTLQQMKKALYEAPLLAEPGTAALLSTAAQFILARGELDVSVDGEQVWNGQIGSVNASSYPVAHWCLVTSNLPLIAPYLSMEDSSRVADALVSSLLSGQTSIGNNRPPGCLSVSIISSQLLQSPILNELQPLFSATVQCLRQKIVRVIKAADGSQVCTTLLKFDVMEREVNQSESDPSKPMHTEAVVEEILAASKTGGAPVLLSDVQTKELSKLLQIITNLNSDGMSSEDLSSLFLLLLFMLTSTCSQTHQVVMEPPNSGDYALLLGKLLRLLTCLLEGRNFQSVLKLMHGGTLLQVVVTSLLRLSNSGQFHSTGSTDWLDLVTALQGFIRSLVRLIIIRNSSVRLNLEQFASYLTSEDVARREIVASKPAEAAVSEKPDAGAAICVIHLLLASLSSFSQEMTSNLGRSKPIDQTLTQMLARTAASLGPTIKAALTPQTVSEPAMESSSVLGQAFVVEVMTVMMNSELSSLSVESENITKATMTHRALYQRFCQQILKEMTSAPRPMDFLLSSLTFLSTFYKAAEKTVGEGEEEGGEERKGAKELDELYVQILQIVHRLLAAPWLSPNDIGELEPSVVELLRHLLGKSSTSQFNLLLLLIRERLDAVKLKAGNYREVLSAVVVTKALSCCQLPELCSKALWLITPQIISAMVFLVRSSSQDTSMTVPFTIPTVKSMTFLLRQGEGRISNPHHVTLVFGALQAVPLDHLSPLVYQSVFLAVHEALFAIIQCHPQVMLNAAPSFLNVFYRLVASIMQEGRQRGDADTDSDVYVQCSRLIERMYSHIAATAESFTTMSAFMVAQYVTELQKVTLRPDIKLHLTEGIYRILDLCMEQDIKFLTAGLQMGVREVFNELYSSYTHYHKTQRQGEDKYTA
ncbi:unhealthy ribosome biogenesis protein 2 homolog [Genypterus blacodes]|uniref:unhealthy ribosome biogenesis protein 2 homolog n=1 Tax=Genypterus blacodes TaxID=154954 RepID=UPI003F76CC92